MEQSTAQTEKRRDDALRRALNTPPQPKTKKVKGGDEEASSEQPRKVEREA